MHRIFPPTETAMTSSTSLSRELSPLLRQRGLELIGLLQESAEGVPDDLHEVLDTKDLANLDSRAAIDEATVSMAARELADVSAALRRIENGTYGVCEECGEPIAEARLRALPATPFCTACQAERERAGH